MLKKLRWRFITVAMIAFSTVIIALLLIINLSTYYSITHQQNETLKMLTKTETVKNNPFSPNTFPAPEFHRNLSPEFPYMLRFFSVYTNEKNEITKVNHDFIASVSQDDAINYAKHVLQNKRQNGYYNNYRYVITRTSTGNLILFWLAEDQP